MAIQRDKVIANAEKLVAKGKIEPAIKEYERLLDDNPSDVNTLNRIGDLWVRINRNDEAVKTFGRIADHYARDGFFLKAIAIYKKINKLDPSKLDVYAKLADLYAKQGLAMEAKSQYQVLADYYIKHGDSGNALAIYRKISELDPQSINVHVKLADLHSQIGQTAEALKEYDRVGRMLLKRGMLDEAVQVFKKALKIDAKNVDLVESLVTALIEAKDYNNAVAIVEQALQTNQDHPRLLALWGKILIAKGDVASARNALEKGLKAEPNEPLIRDALADLYLKQNDANKALEMLVPLVERAVSKGERGQAVEMLNRVMRVDQRHTPTLERLVALYTRLNEETNILSSMNLLAEAHIARKQFQQASEVLQRLIDREPQNSQHRTKLQFVKSQMGGGAEAAPAAPIRPKPAPEIPVMEVEEPAPTFEAAEEAPAITLGDLESGPPIELDFSEVAEQAPGISAEMPGAEGEADEDLDFITEHLTEAEVFAKYGLAEKAAEHLRAIIDRAPKHLPAYDRLFRILLDEGDVEGARTVANQYVVLLEEKSDRDSIDAVRNEFLVHGQSLTVGAAKPPAKAKAAVAEREPEPELEVVEEVSEEAPVEVESDAELAADLEKQEEVTFDLDAGPAEVEMELEAATPAPAPEPEPELAPEPVAEREEEINFGEVEEAPPLEIAEEEPQPFFGVEAEAPAPEVPTPEEIGEIDFYIEQELFDEARKKADALLARFPDNEEITSRIGRIKAAAAEAARAAAPPPPPPPPPKAAPKPAPPAAKTAAAPPPPPPKPAPRRTPTLSREEIDSELLSAIPDDEEFGGTITPAPAPPPPPAATPTPPPAFAAAPAQEENLFADEDNFFDLAAELESELQESDEVVSLSEEEQSLEEIFKEFKKGVEQQLDSEDYDTHYNLGIAYKEMGLIDEAIGEFQLASKDPKRAVECASMLGLCFLEKGMPQLAIKWYRKGLEMPEITEEEHIGLLYDLGSAHVEVGDTDNAQKAFMEVYAINNSYRDIVSRIKQLEDAKR
ncbi:MAG TPA: tetratricopeptide repeat protein [Thermoanaerobaculia bacterium]|nr:tetratricopeptide repeat protein [Thermoanaerobaculia bacterium]